MRGRLTDQAAVAVALARTAAGAEQPTIAHLLIGLVTEPEGRAGRRLRERATAAANLMEQGGTAAAPSMAAALSAAVQRAAPRVASTVDLLDAAIANGGAETAQLLTEAGYHRDLDGWLTADPASEWFEDAETFGFHPSGDARLDPSASRVVAQVRAIDGGAVDLLIAAVAAPDGPSGPDPGDLAAVAARLRGGTQRWDAGLDTVVDAADRLREGEATSVRDLVRAALVAGGDGPALVLSMAQ